MQAEVEDELAIAQDDFSQIERLINKAGLIITEKPEGEPSIPEKIQYRYFLLATYYGDAAHYAVVALPLSRHEYHRAIQASMYVGSHYNLPKFEPLKDRGLQTMLGDLAILRRDMEFVPEELRRKGRFAIIQLELRLAFAGHTPSGYG